MKTSILLFFGFIMLSSTLFCQNLNPEAIKADLKYFDQFLQEYSCYQGLNGYNYKGDFDQFLASLPDSGTSKVEFGLFLTKVIGKIGDRHAYLSGYDLPKEKYFPFTFAPLEKNVLVVNYNRKNKQYDLYNSQLPYLKAIDGIPIDQFLSDALPEEIKAPKEAYFTRVLRELRDIGIIYAYKGLKLPDPLPITLSILEGLDSTFSISLVSRKQKQPNWDEKFYRKHQFLKTSEYTDSIIQNDLFQLDDGIAYLRIPKMFHPNDVPAFFEQLPVYMESIRESKGLIIDVRNNGGGSRPLIWELAGYLINPDSIYVVNVAQQRAELPLNESWTSQLNNRLLYAYTELAPEEQHTVDQFLKSFKPKYSLDSEKFSPYHFAIFNGPELSKDKFHYDKPVYILANERSFSAATVFVAAFKGLPNIKTVGANTDENN